MNDANIWQDFREMNIVPWGLIVLSVTVFLSYSKPLAFFLLNFLPLCMWWNTYLELTLGPQCLNYCPLREYSWSGKSLYPSFDLSTAGCNYTAKSSLKMLSHFWSERSWVSRMLLQLCAHKVDWTLLPYLDPTVLFYLSFFLVMYVCVIDEFLHYFSPIKIIA